MSTFVVSTAKDGHVRLERISGTAGNKHKHRGTETTEKTDSLQFRCHSLRALCASVLNFMH